MTPEERELWSLMRADPAVRAWAIRVGTRALAAAIGLVLGLAIVALVSIGPPTC